MRRLPTLPIDQDDRRAIASAAILVLLFVVAFLLVAAGVGIGVRVFLLASGLGG